MQMVLKPKKKYANSLIIREKQIKTIEKYNILYLVDWVKSETLITLFHVLLLKLKNKIIVIGKWGNIIQNNKCILPMTQ